MIEGKNIVCLTMTTWESEVTNTLVQMMSILSRKNKVLFVDYPFTIKDLIAGHGARKNIPFKQILGKEKRLRTVKTKYSSEVNVLTLPPVLPINWIKNYKGFDYFLELNSNWIRPFILDAIKELHMDDFIVVNGYNPFLGMTMVNTLNESLHVYYCYDEIGGDQWYKYHGPRAEKIYIPKADVVIATSDALYYSKKELNPATYVVKNGVDFELFNSMSHPESLEKKDHHRIIGYSGSVDERFDINLMEYVIESCPQYRFAFLGRVTNHAAKERLEKFENVCFLGSKKAEEVPLIVRDFDVTLIPYLKNKVTSGVYPLKINEYLAMGKPVVMTDFAVLEEFSGIVSFAKNKEQFLEMLVKEVEEDSLVKRAERISVARNNSWEQRVEEFSVILNKNLLNVGGNAKVA